LTFHRFVESPVLVQLSFIEMRPQPPSTIDGAGTCTLNYDHANRLTATSYTAGSLAGITVTNHFGTPNGRDWLGVLQSTSTLVQQSFAYDTYGRLGTVASGNYSADYGYLPNADLLQTTTCKNTGSTVLTTTRSWDRGVRLSAIINQTNGGGVVTSHSYQYDSAGRRTRAALEDGSVWVYDYNDRDELTGARRYWADWSPVSGEFFGYDYDNIGNRKSAWSGGDVNGAYLHQTTYTANALNQYTAISNPGYEQVLGVALATNAVTVKLILIGNCFFECIMAPPG
jgi:YD repeat-containing protein